MTRYRISPHFVVEEFDSRDGRRVPTEAHPALALWARVWGEPLREAFGPVRITSGYRSTAHNAAVGGAPLSFHVYTLRYGASKRPALGVGVAADVVPARGDVARWQRWASARLGAGVPDLGRSRGAAVGYPASGFIHLDTGPRRSWAG